MTPWKFTDASRRCAARIHDDGRQQSQLTAAFSEAELATILAPDPTPPPTQTEQDLTAARADATLEAIKGMTPAQIDAWMVANVTNLGQARTVITKLAIAVSILWRERAR